MKARLVTLLFVIAAFVWANACSSGLGGGKRRPPSGGTGGSSTNLPVGFELGLVPSAPVTEPQAAGVVVPGIGGGESREVVLLAFTTAADATERDGTGPTLSRDAVADGNGAADVFVAAVSAQDVDARAFSQALAGKFRHPRCTTCHSMQAPDTLAFASSPQPHAGPMPGPSFPNNAPDTCSICHVNATLFPVPGWQAPAASFDLRHKTVAELAEAAKRVPVDETEHFVSDPRVLWALDSGILPQVNGNNGIADDDHDGVLEPEDTDGVIRTVPGGSTAFIAEIMAWRASGELVTPAASVADITLVSRAAGGAGAGNGASTAPRIVWVPNPGFNPTTAATAAATNPIGTLYVAYQSDAADLVAAGDGNGATDVFRTAVELRAEEDENGAPAAGGLNLRTLDTTILCSATNGTTTAGDGASTRPAIGGSNGDRVAFESQATNLVGAAPGGGASQVYVRLTTGNQTSLISHAVGNTAIGGDGDSAAVAIDPTGVAVAFESDATDLIALDTNGVRDVFFARIDGGAPFTKQRASVTSTGAEGTGGASSAASIQVAPTGRVLVAFQSDAIDLAAALVAPTNVFLFDGNTGRTTLLNQRLTPSDPAIGDGSARRPVLDAAGARVAFESDARNIDVLREDGNRFTDVFLVETSQVAAGSVLPYRFSLTTAEATDANGPSTAPSFGSFVGSPTYKVGFAVYSTAATNLGTTDSTNLVVAFLDETSGVLADFTVTPTAGVAPLTVQFTDASSGTPTAWAWDFDNDGSVDSNERNPLHTYTTPGTYTVRLVAGNATSQGESIKTDVVRAIGPVAPEFSATPTSGTAPLTVQFTDLSTEQPTAWSWDFGDGSTPATGQNPMHTYTTAGTYTVSLTATNEAGAQTITKPGLVQVFEPVVAGFTLTPSSGVVPLAVTFTNMSTGATSYVWDFGDGSPTSTNPNPVHSYTSSGTFDVTLTATGPGGVDTVTQTGAVMGFGMVNASFTISANSAYTNQTISLNASASTPMGQITSYEWDFDGNFGTIEAMGVTVGPISVGTNFPTSSQTGYTIRLRVTAPGGTSIASRPFTSVAASETLNNLAATEDTTIYANPPSNTLNGNGNGASTRLVVGKTFTNGFRRALVKFDVSGVPAGSTILGAVVRLRDASPAGTAALPSNMGNSQLTGTQTFTFHRVTSAWSEGTGNGAAGIGTTTGASATFANTGSNFNGVATGSITFNNPVTVPTLVYSTFTSTSLASDVQLWVNNPPTFANNGWMIKSATESGANNVATIKWFESSEGTNPPRLDITYRRPLP